MISLVFLITTAFVAGFIDTLVGGGGFITVPALLITGIPPVTALGTNKLLSAVGELSASWQFLKKKSLRWQGLLGYFLCTALGACIGAILLQFVSNAYLAKLIPVLLTIVFVYYLMPKKVRFSTQTESVVHHWRRIRFLAPVIGFYNGFLGPGTGAIWSVALVKRIHMDIKQATIYTKSFNLVGNLGAFVVFVYVGKIYWLGALVMAVGAYWGGRLGAHFVMYRDIKFFKVIFIFLFVVLISSTAVKYYF